MKKTRKIFEELKKNQLIALLTPKSRNECLKAFELFHPFGVILEIALRSGHAIEGIRAVLAKYPEALVLAGTVMTGQQTEDAINAGAAGIVSADYITEVVDVCVKNDVLCIPGGLSDAGKQLVQKAERYGCSLEVLQKKYPYQWVYKLFPAFSGRLSHMDLPRSWRGPYRDLTVIYTGGITLETLKEAVKRDPQGIFCASALTKHIDKPESVRKDVEMWKEVLQSRPSIPSGVREEKKVSKNLPEVITFGEMLMRLSPSPGIRLLQARNFDLNFGGAEANVSVSLARFGLNACYITVLPENDIGDNACDTLKMHGIDTRFIVRKGRRMGIYFLEHGSGPRPSKVIYDRSHSSFSEIEPGDVDWRKVLEKAAWFHWTGITPALSELSAATLHEGLEVAKEMKITVSAELPTKRIQSGYSG